MVATSRLPGLPEVLVDDHDTVPLVEPYATGLVPLPTVYELVLPHTSSFEVPLTVAVGTASMVSVKVAVAGGLHELLLVRVRVTILPLVWSFGPKL